MLAYVKREVNSKCNFQAYANVTMPLALIESSLYVVERFVDIQEIKDESMVWSQPGGVGIGVKVKIISISFAIEFTTVNKQVMAVHTVVDCFKSTVWLAQVNWRTAEKEYQVDSITT